MSTYPTSERQAAGLWGPLRYRKVSIMTPEPRDAYPSTISRGNPILVERIHGRGFLRNSRLAHVENGKVFGLHVETMEIAKCIFREDSEAGSRASKESSPWSVRRYRATATLAASTSLPLK